MPWPPGTPFPKDFPMGPAVKAPAPRPKGPGIEPGVGRLLGWQGSPPAVVGWDPRPSGPHHFCRSALQHQQLIAEKILTGRSALNTGRACRAVVPNCGFCETRVWAPSCPRGPTWTEQGARGAGRERVEQDTEGAGQGASGVPAVGDGWRGQGHRRTPMRHIRRGDQWSVSIDCMSPPYTMGAFSHSVGTARAQRGHSANYYGDYPGNNPETHPRAESCTINSKLKNSNI